MIHVPLLLRMKHHLHPSHPSGPDAKPHCSFIFRLLSLWLGLLQGPLRLADLSAPHILHPRWGGVSARSFLRVDGILWYGPITCCSSTLPLTDTWLLPA